VTTAFGAALHVTNGDSAGDVIERSRFEGRVLSWQDVPHEGPLLPGTRRDFLHARAAFLAEEGWQDAATIRRALEGRDRKLLEALREGREAVLWFEHDLLDQLQLIEILSLAGEPDCNLTGLQLLNTDAVEGRPEFHGLGELEPDELEPLWPLRRPVTPELVELARAAWAAVRAPDPQAVVALLDEDTAQLPFLAAALERFLEELPDVAGGLSRTERQLLETLVEGPLTPPELFVQSARREVAPFLGDSWFWQRLARLARGQRPLVSTAGGAPIPEPPPRGDTPAFVQTRFQLTDHGRAVLGGELDWVEAVGLDRWVGGTRLRPENDWRWSSRERELRAPSVESG